MDEVEITSEVDWLKGIRRYLNVHTNQIRETKICWSSDGEGEESVEDGQTIRRMTGWEEK